MRELDYWIAEHIEGWTRLDKHPDGGPGYVLVERFTGRVGTPFRGPWFYPPGFEVRGNGVEVPLYSEEMEYAWPLAQEFGKKYSVGLVSMPSDMGVLWRFSIDAVNAEGYIVKQVGAAGSECPATAICLALKEAVQNLHEGED